MLIIFNKQKWESYVRVMTHREFLFNKRVVGLWLKEPFWSEGFCLQVVRVGDKQLYFIFKEFKQPFFFSKRKVYKKLKETFSFIPKEYILIPTEEDLREFNKKPSNLYISYPKKGNLPEGKNGVSFKTKRGTEFYFLINDGKPLPKEEFLTLISPLPPLPCFI